MKRIILILIFVLIMNIPVLSYPFKKEVCNLGWEHVHHEHNEEAYQYAWCSAHIGRASCRERV